ncbi:hypothetical protein [Microcoleus sp. K4-C2]|uniref:hypothetical protein n=1 Tax=Microcoleus sp. K4-C2 TaxID=2818792 RepID=UPI002FCF8BDD
MHSDEQLPEAAFLLRSSFWLPDLRDFGNKILSNSRYTSNTAIAVFSSTPGSSVIGN